MVPDAVKHRARATATVLIALLAVACSGDDDSQSPAAPQEQIAQPRIAAGDRRIAPGVEATYATVGASSSFGHGLEFRFEFDGQETSWADDNVAAHTWPAAGRLGVRAQARCGEHPQVESVWSQEVLIVVASGFLVDFETPDLGADTMLVADPYPFPEGGIIFWSEGSDALVGLVKNRSAGACADPPNDNQKLGTCLATVQTVGHWPFDITAGFQPELPLGITVRVQVQVEYNTDVTLRFMTATGAHAGIVTVNAWPPQGDCGNPLVTDRARVTIEAKTADRIAYAVVSASPHVFVIDNFEIIMPAP